MHNAATGLRDSIQNDISSANSVIQSAIDAINKVNPFSDIKVPTIPVPNLDALANVTLPDSFTQALTNLNNSIPTVAQIKDEIESMCVCLLFPPPCLCTHSSLVAWTSPLNF